MSFTPSKRPFELNSSEPTGRGKWRKTAPSGSQQSPLKVPPGAVVFRILCPVSKSGSVIGKGGGIISRIRQETGAKVRLDEIIPGCDERVIVITGSEKDAEVSNEHAKEGDDKASVDQDDTRENNEKASGGNNDEKVNDENDDDKVSGENDEEKDEEKDEQKDEEKDEQKDEVKDNSFVPGGSKSDKAPSSAQKALLLVFERIIEGEGEDDDGDEANKGASVSVRLLILSSQVGCLLGMGGRVIKQMASNSGAQIRILPKDKIPACASSIDEIVQISGGVDSARKALQSVSQQLLENPPRDPFPATKAPPSHPFTPTPRPEALPLLQFGNRQYDVSEIPPLPKFHENVGPGQLPPGSQELLMFRLLCSNEKVGSVIGRGGTIIKSLKHETGCDIKILETTPETEDRIIVISSPAMLPLDQMAPAQDGVLQVQHRIAMADPDNNENVLSRLLVSSYQIGCLIGKNGAIISEMRKLSGAHIRILTKDQLPRSVPENDELVQVSGGLGAVQDALLHITAKLRNYHFRERIPPLNHGGPPPFHDQMPPFGPYMGRRESPPPRMFPNFPPFQKDFIARYHDERPPFPHAIFGPGFPPHSLDRMPPVPWSSQNPREGGGGGSMPIPDYPGGPPRRIGGFTGGNHPAVITSTTVDVIVPRAIVPSIYGEDGGCLRRIREISEAKITITEPRPEATETVIIISGTPEQTHAAQSLIQAFVLIETGAA